MENRPCPRDCPHLMKGYCKFYKAVLEPIDDEAYFRLDYCITFKELKECYLKK